METALAEFVPAMPVITEQIATSKDVKETLIVMQATLATQQKDFAKKNRAQAHALMPTEQESVTKANVNL
jgi:hypothetical protein